MPLNETTQVQIVQVAIHGKSAYIIKNPFQFAISNTQLKNKQVLSALIWEKKRRGSHKQKMLNNWYSLISLSCVKSTSRPQFQRFVHLFVSSFPGHETGRMPSLLKTSVMDVGNLLAIADSWISPNGFHWRRVQKGSLPGRNCSRFLHTCGPLFRVFW